VYRSYDNRVNPTPRCPDFYLFYGRDDKGPFPWLDKVTTEASLEHSVQPDTFGTKVNKDTNDDLNVINTPSNVVHLLSFGGQVQIISVPYVEGSHCPTNTKQLVCIAKQLQDMHSKKWKHADLRLCNMVFDGDEGHLIDFDFSGRGEVRYPEGFVETLFDTGGSRPGKELEFVSAHDDTEMFFKILTFLTGTNEADKLAYYSAVNLSIKGHLRAFTASIKAFRESRSYQGTQYDKEVDDFECEESVSFFNKTIEILEATEIDLEVDDVRLRDKLESHVASRRGKSSSKTMEGDTRTP
jgi:serine/threonine protein kinase